MYNGIGLTTPRGSGTNGHVQRNWAFVRPGKKDNSNYRSEEDMKKLDATLNRPPNKEILDHDRKRKIEVKCVEFEEILEKQGLSSDEIKSKVDSYRNKLIGQGKSDIPKDEFGRIAVRDSHQIAEAQQEKNAKLREAFNISEYFVEGSSFDSDRKIKENLAKSLALQKELDIQRDQTAATAAKEKESSKRYGLVRTPSMGHDLSSAGVSSVVADNDDNTNKRKKKKKTRESSSGPDRKKDKKKKSKKRKKESKTKKSKKLRKRKGGDSNVDNNKEPDEDTESEIETEVKKSRKRTKKDKKKRKNKKKVLSSSSDKSRSTSPSENTTKKKETLTRKKSYGYQCRSRSKERSHKLKESQRRRYESSEDSLNRRFLNDRNKNELRGNSRCKNLSSRRSRSRIERNDSRREYLHDSYIKRASPSRDYRSRERNDTTYSIKDGENRRSRSRQRSHHGDIATEQRKNLKRKHSEENMQRKRTGPGVNERKRCSRSQSPSVTKESRNIKHYSKTIENENKMSRTPSQKPLDNQRKVNKSRSRSASVKKNLRNKSLTPRLQKSKRVDSKIYYTNSFANQEKSDLKTYLKNKKHVGRKSRSRTASTFSSNASSSDTETSETRTPTPKKEQLRKPSTSSIDVQKPLEQKQKSGSPIRTPTKKISKSRHVINEKKEKDKQRSEERYEKSKKQREEHNKLSCRTPPPPPKLENKMSSPRSSIDSSELSYSPARHNPERYRDILENNEKSKFCGNRKDDRKDMVKSLKQSEEREGNRKERVGKTDRSQAKPVVRLQSQSDEDSDVTERNTEKILDEFQESKRERELKDLKMLEQLKTGIAAKAKEKIKTIEKMAASTSSTLSSNNDGEVSDKSYKHAVRNSLNDFLAANNVAPAVVATCSSIASNSMSNSPPGAIYPQTLEERNKEQESVLQPTKISNHIENNKINNKDNETQATCKKLLVTANGHALPLSPTASPLRKNTNITNKVRDRKRERDFREREREREANNFKKDRYLERRQRLSPIIYSTGGGGIGGGTVGGGSIVGGRRNNNSTTLNINHRQQRLNLMCNFGVLGGHHHNPHTHIHPHYHHPNHKVINNHHSSNSSSTTYISNNSTNPHILMCNHANNSTNVSFNRPSRINNTPLITATQFNNQMLSKQSNSILVNRRDHRTALNLGLSGTPCTNFSNSNLLLTKANTNSHHLHAMAVGHVVGGGHHHHHHHHHGQNTIISSGGSNAATQITDRILMAASIAASHRNNLGLVHSAASSVAAATAANNLNFLQQQNKPKLIIKPFKINDSQPLVAALADSSLVDAIVSKVSTATVAAAESAARRSRSRSRRSRSRNRHAEKTGSGGSKSCERDGNRGRSTSHSRSSSSTSSRSRSRSQSHRSSRSHSFQSSSLSHTSSRSSSSSSFGSSRSGTRSPSIPRRRGSPSFLDRRRITSARKRPIPYHRKMPSDLSSCYCSSCCSRDSSPRSRSPSRSSRSPSRFF